MNQGAIRYPYRGLALGVFAGVVLAEALSALRPSMLTAQPASLPKGAPEE